MPLSYSLKRIKTPLQFFGITLYKCPSTGSYYYKSRANRHLKKVR
ncbi:MULTISPECIES: hypothetical protein [Priestia]|nr:hypothetical protein [Priestia megaterium]